MIGTAPLISVYPQQLVPKGTRVVVFQNIFWVFLVLGTAVGIVVIGYMFWNAYKYREGNGKGYEDEDRPELGEIPKGGGKGRKLFVSFALSAVIVVSLIVWTYGMLLYVEGQDTGQVSNAVGEDVEQDPVVVEVTGYRFNWSFAYENGKTTNGRMVVPEDRVVQLRVTSDDVFHNFGVPAFRVKADAIPGQTTSSWFVADETGRYPAICYELCGQGHSGMIAYVHVVSQEEYQRWYDNETNTSEVTGSLAAPGRAGAGG